MLASLRFLTHRAERETHRSADADAGETVLKKLSSLHVWSPSF
jgi:hypothetical protein